MSKPVQWYPGHMFKAKKEIQEVIKIIDIVIEIVDARVPLSSHNEMLDDIVKKKPRLVVFSKSDLVNERELQKYVDIYTERGYETIVLNLKKNNHQKKLLNKIDEVSKPVKEKFEAKGINKKIRALIMGMPNVGKSTFINFATGKKKTEIGNKPGVTKRQQWIRIAKDLELLDTPGILIPKIENQMDGFNLVLCSLIKEEVVDKEAVAIHLLEYLYNNHVKVLEERYSINLNEWDIEKIYNDIAKSIGAILPRNEFDYNRVTNTLIMDFRNQKFGAIILDEIVWWV